MAYVYIIYSASIDKYYIGMCRYDVEERIRKHNNTFYGTAHFTAQATDWKLFLSIEVPDEAHAVRLERKIKKMKSRKYIENLKKYKELRDRIVMETST